MGVESVIHHSLLAIVCTGDHDWQILSRQFVNNSKLRVSIYQSDSGDPENIRVPSREEMGPLAYDALVADMISAPTPIMQVLSRSSRINTIPIWLEDRHSSQDIARFNFPLYLAGLKRVQVTRSSYGGGVTTRYTNLYPAKFLQVAVDQARKLRLESTRDSVQAELNNYIRQLDALREKHTNISTKFDLLEREKQKLIEDRTAIKGEERRYMKLQIDLDIIKNEFEQMHLNTDITAMQAEIRERLAQSTKDRCATMRKITGITDKLLDCESRRVNNVVEVIANASKLVVLEEAQRANKQKIEQAEANMETVDNEYRQCKAVAKEASLAFRRIWESASEVDCDAAKGETPDDLEEIDRQLIALKAKSQLNYNTDPMIVREYESKMAKLHKLKEELKTEEAALVVTTTNIEKILESWHKPLTDLVELTSTSFSNYMRQLGCAGEVRLREPERDYANWGLEILVKFRSSEQLQQLTKERQSGGERSVSTILYLLSLQELGTAPFRVVDEINQGMDQRNERLVHELLVRTSCREDTAQYFLITPKLLPDLFYHEKMKILCIFNGENVPSANDWSPETYAKGLIRAAA